MEDYLLPNKDRAYTFTLQAFNAPFTPAPPPSSSTDDDGLSDGAIAGIAIGAIAGVGLLGAFAMSKASGMSEASVPLLKSDS